MKNPWNTYKDWWKREEELARAKSGWQLFWHSLTTGLLWSIWMIVWLTLIDFFFGHYTPERAQYRASIFFACGMFFGLLVWIKRATFDKSGRVGN